MTIDEKNKQTKYITISNSGSFNHIKSFEFNKVYKSEAIQKLNSGYWFIVYDSTAKAFLFSNSIYLSPTYENLYKVEVWGRNRQKQGMYSGWEYIRILKKVDYPKISIEQQIEIAIKCLLKINLFDEFKDWAKDWISGYDRTVKYIQSLIYGSNITEIKGISTLLLTLVKYINNELNSLYFSDNIGRIIEMALDDAAKLNIKINLQSIINEVLYGNTPE